MPIRNQLDPKIEATLQDAVHSELFASNLYKHIANQMQRIGYFGAQKWFLHESSDELTHYQKLADYLNDRGAVAEIPAIEAMTEVTASLREAIELAYNTELQLQNDYADWYRAAADDPITQQRLLEFLEIQRTSVGEYGDLISRLDRAADDTCGILLIDQELAEKAEG
jgi:ferritin